MPIDYKEYHPKWSLISRLIRFHRAKNRCEKCGLDNGHFVVRSQNNRDPIGEEWEAMQDLIKIGHTFASACKKMGVTKIVLTVAHLDHDKTNNRFNNLAALCQKCHLHHDRHQHAANRKYGRDHKENNFQLNFEDSFGEP